MTGNLGLVLRYLLVSMALVVAAPLHASAAARVDDRIVGHATEKARLARLPAREAALARSTQGLSAEPDAETLALYVHQRLLPHQQAELLRLGVRLDEQIYVPAMPQQRHPYGYHFAHVPYAQLAAVARLPYVVQLDSLEIAAEPDLDIARGSIQALPVMLGVGMPARTGVGVKVCIADSGVDLTHPDFSAPVETFDVTTGPSAATWSTTVANTVSSHGTHVSGAVVGSGANSGGLYRGMAPAASWYFYKIGDNTTANAAFGDMVKALARSQAVGCAVYTMSYGGLGADVDGSSAVGQAIDAAVAAGVTVFASAGNSASASRHISVVVPASGSANVTLQVLSNTGAASVGVSAFWRDGNPNDGNITVTGFSGGGSPSANSPTARNTEFLIASQSWGGGGVINVTPTLVIANAAAAAVTVELYVSGTNGSTTVSVTNPLPVSSGTISGPAIADGAIAVGAWVTRTQWEDWTGLFTNTTESLGSIASFSSIGPRIDGRLKPELVAPGAATISTADSVIPDASANRIDDDGNGVNGSGPSTYFAASGTSMATPIAAGAAVLLLEAVPEATPAFVRSALMATASQADSPNNTVGSGLLQLKDAVLYEDCGDGLITGAEACDDGNEESGDCCSATCKSEGVCEDDNACTTSEYCLAGACAANGSLDCNDDNPCTSDSCDPVAGCMHGFVAGDCDDNNPCTLGDTCAFGQCQQLPKLCFDADPCTTDTCNPVSGACQFAYSNGAVCDDGSACTVDDLCVYGGCQGVGVNCDDNDLCTSEFCMPGSGTCSYTVLGMLCDDDNPCTTDGCQPATGACGNIPHGGPCSDDNGCTSGDSCSDGQCLGLNKNCNDANPCTLDDCDGSTGACTYFQTALACDDGDQWTYNDKCSAGSCKGLPILCDDGDPCTWQDHQTNAGCKGTPANCDDGDPCTTEVCYPEYGGICNSIAKFCADTNDCTTDTCNPKTGECLHETLTGTVCYDPYWCTLNDTCKAGVCSGTPKVCADGDPCTDDSCNENGGGTCWFAANTAACDDGLTCTTADSCQDGTCKGQMLDCNDANGCTIDSCDPAVGCVYSWPLASFPLCDDGEVCTEATYCWEGNCVGGSVTNCDDGQPCTVDSCLTGIGCSHEVLDAACDDGNVCTADSCANTGECLHAPIADLPCIDNSFCTAAEHCVAGVCSMAMVDCSDGDPCTIDSCGYQTGGPPEGSCHHDPTSGGPCDDGDPCTSGEVCSAGECMTGQPTCVDAGADAEAEADTEDTAEDTADVAEDTAADIAVDMEADTAEDTTLDTADDTAEPPLDAAATDAAAPDGAQDNPDAALDAQALEIEAQDAGSDGAVGPDVDVAADVGEDALVVSDSADATGFADSAVLADAAAVADSAAGADAAAGGDLRSSNLRPANTGPCTAQRTAAPSWPLPLSLMAILWTYRRLRRPATQPNAHQGRSVGQIP